jgi:hypothetical protein
MEIWTIFRQPFPDHYVARKFLIDKPTSEFVLGKTLEEVRNKLPPGLVLIARDPKDHPNVVESWL